MLKKLTILLFSIFLIAFNANAGSDGELVLKKNKRNLGLLTDLKSQSILSKLEFFYLN